MGQVPRLDQFSDVSLVNGKNILILKARHQCQSHKGEHGEPGHCYVAPNGMHIALNNRKFARWASAMVRSYMVLFKRTLTNKQTVNEATKDTPPNCEDFEAAFQSQRDGPRSCNRTGPYPASLSPSSSQAVISPSSTLGVDINALLAVALLPMINRMTQGPANFSNGLSHAETVTVPQPRNPSITSVTDIMDFLEAFKFATQFDVVIRASALADLDFTPSLIANETISSTRLGEVLGLREGGVLAIQKFAKEWVGRIREGTS